MHVPKGLKTVLFIGAQLMLHLLPKLCFLQHQYSMALGSPLFHPP